MKSFLVLSICVAVAVTNAESQYYGYALPSGYASATVNGISPDYKPVKAIPAPTNYGYHRFYAPSAQPIAREYYSQPANFNSVVFNPIARYNSLNYYGRQPTYASITRNTIPVVQSPRIIAPAKPVAPVAVTAAPIAKTAALVASKSNPNELETNAEKGFKLLDDLVKTVSEARGTAADSDPTEVDAVKSIFPDIIDTIIDKVESNFKGNKGVAQKNAFVANSRSIKQAINSAPTQSMISSILTPYIANLKSFTSKGLQSVSL